MHAELKISTAAHHWESNHTNSYKTLKFLADTTLILQNLLLLPPDGLQVDFKRGLSSTKISYRKETVSRC
jgi:hypothetical protein